LPDKEKHRIEGETKLERKARKRLERYQKQKEKLRKHLEKSIKFDDGTPSTKTNIAFVLGNGTSRKDIPLEPLKQYGLVYACNAVYRDFRPDHLIAVDTKMVREITDTRYNYDNMVWTNPNRYTRGLESLNLMSPNLGWSSGPTALMLATQHSHEEIYILGFDYKGLENGTKVNNIFAGTPNYKQKEDRATYYGNWSRQTNTCIKKNSTVRYIRVIEDKSSFIPDNLLGLDNLTHITVEDFRKKFSL
jgi:hypothetical protein